MHSQHPGAVGHLPPQVTRQPCQHVQQASLAEHAAGPADPGRHEAVTRHQVRAAGGVSRRGVRSGLLTGEDVAISVPPQHLNLRQLPEKLEDLGRPRAEQDQVPQHPPAIDLTASGICQHRTQGNVVSVNVRQDAESHERELIRRIRAYTGTRSAGNVGTTGPPRGRGSVYAREHARQHPDQPAIIMAASGQTVSYGGYEAGCDRLAHALRAAGLQRGDHIAVLIENSPRLLEIEGAAERTGLYFTLINTYLAPDEVAYIVTNSRSRIFFSSAGKQQLAEAAAARCPQLERLIMSESGTPGPGWESYDDFTAGYPSEPVPGESLGTAMLYSSGTTGQPKGVLRELQDIAPDAVLPVMGFVSAMFGFRPGMTYLNPAPLYHSAPQASVSATLRLGATAVVMEHFDAEQWLAAVQRYRVTHCQMVPVMFSRLLRLPAEVRARYDTSSLECIVHAAAPCPVHVKQAMFDWLGPIITEYYGATEANGFTFCDSAQWLAHPGTVGAPILGELLILDDNGDPVPAGADGTIWFRGATAFTYFQDPVKTAGSRDADGSMSTVGDVGHVDTDGYLYLTDRKSYMIISGGVNIYPQETENFLSGHPAVLDVAVIGVPNEDLGEEVKAVVQPADPAAAGPELAAELIAYCRDNLAHFKCPRTVDFADELPRYPTGKLYKRILRDKYWEGHQTPIV
jgi:long-chain acyl-CoA synthetase